MPIIDVLQNFSLFFAYYHNIHVVDSFGRFIMHLCQVVCTGARSWISFTVLVHKMKLSWKEIYGLVSRIVATSAGIWRTA